MVFYSSIYTLPIPLPIPFPFPPLSLRNPLFFFPFLPRFYTFIPFFIPITSTPFIPLISTLQPLPFPCAQRKTTHVETGRPSLTRARPSPTP